MRKIPEEFLQAMRQMTFESDYFTNTELADAASVPRSTSQDWTNRLLREGCIFTKEEMNWRHSARYASRSAMPSTTCNRIFATFDGDLVEIFHECLSSGCAGFCEFHRRSTVSEAGWYAASRGSKSRTFFPIPICMVRPLVSPVSTARGIWLYRRSGQYMERLRIRCPQ